MKKRFSIILFIAIIMLVSSCASRKLVDKVVLKNASTLTGKITQADSAKVILERQDRSVQHIPWQEIDSVSGIRYKTFFSELALGYAKTPYFSVFRNESFNPAAFSITGKIGIAQNRKNVKYLKYSFLPAKPYNLRKIGIGFQRYAKGTYFSKNSFFWGNDFSLILIPYNNAPQLTFEPFCGYSRYLTPKIRVNAQWNLQLNPFGKNASVGTGLNFSILYHFKDINARYSTLNQLHKLSSQ
jgi:hypothetical protein